MFLSVLSPVCLLDVAFFASYSDLFSSVELL